VQAHKGKKSGSNTGTAGALTTKLNVALVNVDMVPEFGMIAGAAPPQGRCWSPMSSERWLKSKKSRLKKSQTK